MARVLCLALLMAALVLAAPALAAETEDQATLDEYEYSYADAEAPAPSEPEDDRESERELTRVRVDEDEEEDDADLAEAPSPSTSQDDDDDEDYDDGKNGKWSVKEKQPIRFREEDGCPTSDEPEDGSEYPFYLGFADAAYQVEGGATKDKRGPSIWDTFSSWSGEVKDNANGDVAADFYGKWKDDIKLLKRLGVRNFRFSVSWSRVLPKGNGTVNEKGLEFYDKLVDELLKNCIEPHVTLYHWDLPFALQLAYKGWIDYKVTDDFADYAEVVFKKLGDRVKHWTTFASPYSFCMLGYGWGSHAPGRCADCPGGGNVTTEPFMCARNVVIAHAKAAKVFKKEVKDGKLGMNLNIDWAEPWDARNGTHIRATERHWDLAVRIFADPLYKAKFPKIIRNNVTNVPRFTQREVDMLKDAKPDFFGLTHYTANFIKDDPYSPAPMYYAQLKESKNKTTFGKTSGSEWLVVYPDGLRRTLGWIAEEYNDPDIVILENGVSVPGEHKRPYPDVLNDEFRMEYFKGYLDAARAAVKEDDVQVTGYYAWKFLDGFEWSEGYSKRFGVTWVNFTSLERKPKNSAFWLARKFNVLPVKETYEKVLFMPVEEKQKKDAKKQKKLEEEKRKAMGGNAPLRLDDVIDALPPALNQPDPASNPFEGGR